MPGSARALSFYRRSTDVRDALGADVDLSGRGEQWLSQAGFSVAQCCGTQQRPCPFGDAVPAREQDDLVGVRVGTVVGEESWLGVGGQREHHRGRCDRTRQPWIMFGAVSGS